MKQKILFSCIILAFISYGTVLSAAEPNMADYTAEPVFMINSVQPNIMIMLDNSGSMNFNAYGNYPGDGGLVSDGWYTGAPYHGEFTISISSGIDDVEEFVTSGDLLDTNSGDMDLGGFDAGRSNSIVGLRFQKLPIKKGAVISDARLIFTSRSGDSSEASLRIEGLAYDDVAKFSTSVRDDLFLRQGTDNRVAWGEDDLEDWVDNRTYTSPDLTKIVQEIVDREGWKEGNSLAFRITGVGKRSAYSFEENATKAVKLRIKTANSTPTRYYGYFNPDYFYKYSSSKFTHAYKKVSYDSSLSAWMVKDLSGNSVTLTNARITSENLWDGNFANWVSMRRIDVLRKVLMGGLATSRTGGGNQVNYGDTPKQSFRQFTKRFDSTGGPQVSPFAGIQYYGLSGGNIYVSGTSTTPWSSSTSKSITIAIQKNDKLEPEDFFTYDSGSNLAGILQKVGDKARWGNIFFNEGTSNASGGTVVHTIGTNMVNLVNDLQNTGADTNTPLAESYYVARQYFKQEDPETGLGYPNNAVPNSNAGDDPFNVNGIQVPCVKNFVLLLTDGASTRDARIPSELKTWSNDGDIVGCDDVSDYPICDYSSGGTDFLDNIALNARQVDLRSDIEGHQDLILYTVYSFGSEENARKLLMDSAKNGGFIDMDGDRTPDGTYQDPPEKRREWDKDGDEIPDTYFEASDGYELEKRLLSAIMSILQRAAAGSSASVLATNSEGEGTMIQAYFRQSITGSNGVEEARWLGFIQSLWIDPWGHLREDTDGDGILDLFNSQPGNTAVDVDRIVSYQITDIDTMVSIYTSHYFYNPDNGENILCTLGAPNSAACTPLSITDTLENIRPVFEAGERLSLRDPSTRKIFTFIDKNSNNTVDEAANSSHFDTTDEVISFGTGSESLIKPYLGIKDDTVYKHFGATHDTRVTNMINYIRGKDISGFRNRTLDKRTWKLGDVIHSTPVSITGAGENFHLIYSDKSYQYFLNAMKNRETMVYVGANDGMLHAFTSWKYNKDRHGFEDPYPSDTSSLSTFIPDEKIGDEVWAFIPQALLPHLKWYADPDYIHSYYVDLKPKIFDAKILPDETHYSDADTAPNWGTFLIGGLRQGGKSIWSEGDYGSGVVTRNFYPTYFCLDITNPRAPRLLWERSYQNLHFTMSEPGIIKVGDNWYAVFGSGPTDYEGNSTQGAYFYVVDLKTGKPYSSGANDWLAGPLESKAFVNSPVSFDKGLNYNVDGIYYGISYYASNKWQGKVYKLGVPCTKCSYDPGFNPLTDTVLYSTDPTKWFNVELFQVPRPVTAPIALSLDKNENLWAFFGTGRYISKADKIDTNQQYLYGIKDPFFNKKKYETSYYLKTTSSKILKETDLYTGSDNIVVTTDKMVLDRGTLYGGSGQWYAFLSDIQKYDGWRISLDPYISSGSERVVSKPAVLGGTVFTPTLVPNEDVCGLGGDSNLYAVYYETGSGYFEQALELPQKEYVDVNSVKQEKVAIKLPQRIQGAPPPRIGLHVGRETDSQFDRSQDGDSGKVASAYLQQSTGQIVNLRIKTALRIKSGLINWREIN